MLLKGPGLNEKQRPKQKWKRKQKQKQQQKQKESNTKTTTTGRLSRKEDKPRQCQPIFLGLLILTLILTFRLPLSVCRLLLPLKTTQPGPTTNTS